MRKRASLMLVSVLLACGSSEPSHEEKLAQERAKAEAACKKGDGPSCFVATVGIDASDKKQLTHSMELWQRGCALDHAASCGQLGTVSEFGLMTGGKVSYTDKRAAAVYYSKACELGDKQSCNALALLR